MQTLSESVFKRCYFIHSISPSATILQSSPACVSSYRTSQLFCKASHFTFNCMFYHWIYLKIKRHRKISYLSSQKLPVFFSYSDCFLQIMVKIKIVNILSTLVIFVLVYGLLYTIFYNSFGSMHYAALKPEQHQQARTTSQEVGDFQREWLRERHRRVDWRSLIKPCMGLMTWGETKPGWGKQNRSNAAASSIFFRDVRPAGEYSKFLIQSRTADGRAKSIGGDWWKVYLRGPASFAATIFDHNNGSYEAIFLIKEPGVYQVEIFLEYSLCDGLKNPPRDWFIKGKFWRLCVDQDATRASHEVSYHTKPQVSEVFGSVVLYPHLS